MLIDIDPDAWLRFRAVLADLTTKAKLYGATNLIEAAAMGGALEKVILESLDKQERTIEMAARAICIHKGVHPDIWCLADESSQLIADAQVLDQSGKRHKLVKAWRLEFELAKSILLSGR